VSEPYLGDIKIFGFNFPPRGWATCDGQILPIDQNQSLFSLLGTMYGGDGRTNFALPDLRGRAPIHRSSSHAQAEKSGEEAHVLQVGELPSHTHTMAASGQDANSGTPSGALYAGAAAPLGLTYSSATATLDTQLAAGSIAPAGNQAMPFLTLNFCIALQGLFPSRN